MCSALCGFKKMKSAPHILLLAATVLMTACMKYGPAEEHHFKEPSKGVFVVCEGNFMYGNASLWYYTPATKNVEREVFQRANAMRLGDVAESMTVHDNTAFIAVNNSGAVFAIGTDDFRLKGVLTDVGAPRFIEILSDTKGYITDQFDSRITVFNPSTLSVTGYIQTPAHNSTEQMATVGATTYVACWSYDKTILGIDTLTDKLKDSVTLSGQPACMTADRYGALWVVTDTGPSGSDSPRLYKLATNPLAVEQMWILPFKAAVDIATDASGNRIYILDRHIWRVNATDTQLPDQPLIDFDNRRLYTLGISPSEEIYTADAIDYVQSGVVYRYSADGTLLDSFKTGIIPGSFCFKK